MNDAVQNLGDLLRRAGERWPGAELAFPDERATFAQLDEQADEMARLVRAAGAEPGSKVAVMLPPSVVMAAAMLGAARAGCVVVPMSERWKSTEVRHVLRHADVRVLLTTDFRVASLDLVAAVVGALPTLNDAPEDEDSQYPAGSDAPELRRVVLLGADDEPRRGFTHRSVVEALPEPDLREPAVGPDDYVYIMYTSGTSSAAKGCLITHGSVIDHAHALATTRYLLDEGDVFWCPIALHHNGGLSSFTQCLTVGASFVHPGFFNAATGLGQLEHERATHSQFGFETIWKPIVEHPRYLEADLSALRVIFSAGTEARLRRLQKTFPETVLLTNYGLTEATGHFSMVTQNDPLDVRMTTGGLPLPGNVARVVDPVTGADCPPDVDGEILIRGRTLFKGYYKDPDATAKVVEPDGWFHTGDRGHLDSAGRVTFVDRLKDVLKVGGENVSSAEVEAHILEHPAVKTAAVVAAPDTKYGEVPTAYLELQEGASVTEREIIDFCVGSISTYKVPRYVRFVTEWPMSSTKVKKPVLRARIADELAKNGIESAPLISPGAPRHRPG